MTIEKKETKEWIYTIIATVVLIFIIRKFIFSPVIVEGDSMNPTLNEGDRLFINKIGKIVGDIDRYDVIVFKDRKGKHYIKRVVGMPGDRLHFKDNKLYINGEKIDEHYTIEDNFQRDLSIQTLYEVDKIPEDCYFVLGDNRPNSTDSRQRSIGLVEDDAILGAVNVVVWPINRMQIVNP